MIARAKFRNGCAIPFDVKASVLAEIASGMSVGIAAKKHGIHPVTIRRWLLDTGGIVFRDVEPYPCPDCDAVVKTVPCVACEARRSQTPENAAYCDMIDCEHSDSYEGVVPAMTDEEIARKRELDVMRIRGEAMTRNSRPHRRYQSTAGRKGA